MRPITGAEVTLTDGSHVTLLVESAQGYANLCRLLTAAHAGTRPKEGAEPLPPSLDARAARRAERGARLPLRVRAARSRGPQPERRERCWRARSGRNASSSSCNGRTSEATQSRLAALRDLAEALGVRTVATGDVHSHHPRRTSLQDVLVAIRHRTSLEGCEAERRGNRESVLLPPGELGDRVSARPRRGRANRRAGRAAGVRPDRGPRLPLSGLLGHGRAGDRAAQARLRPRVRRALRRSERPQAQGAPPARGGAEADRGARPRGVLPSPLGGAGAGAGVRAGGARRVGGAQRAPAGPRPRKLGRLDRLLPDRALARRPGARGPSARALPQPRARLGAGHRPRLPARHPGEADRRRLRALRPRALGARRELRDLPRPRGDPRRRQGARPPVRRARAVGAAHGRQPSEGRRGAGEAARRRVEAGLSTLARVRRAVRRARRPAAARLAAPGRDGDLDPAAGRARPGAARGDGRPPALPVGQGLVRGCGLPEDRPARARDALGGRGLRRADRPRARRDN